MWCHEKFSSDENKIQLFTLWKNWLAYRYACLSGILWSMSSWKITEFYIQPWTRVSLFVSNFTLLINSCSWLYIFSKILTNILWNQYSREIVTTNSNRSIILYCKLNSKNIFQTESRTNSCVSVLSHCTVLTLKCKFWHFQCVNFSCFLVI